MINNTVTAETKKMEMIVIGSKSPVRYLACADFIDHSDSEFEEECEEEEA